MIKTILFDYAGVITPVSNNFDFAMKYSSKFKLSPEELMKISYENWAEAATGKISPDVFWKNISDKLNIKPDALRNMIIETFTVDKRMLKIIKDAHKNYTTVLFSNQIEDWIEKVLEENNMRDLFDHVVNSYTVGARKPEKKIFLEALRKTSSKPEETLFIDDDIKNIDAARKMRINTILFKDYKSFLKEYKKFIESDQAPSF